jgi:pSer/pThr/pTyr-binding forkhead associated (FHA) protein
MRREKFDRPTVFKSDVETRGGVSVIFEQQKKQSGARLIFFDGKTYYLGNVTRIGRDFENEVIIEGDDEVSRNHCVITKHEEGYYIRDLASMNFTYLNEVPVGKGKEKLKDGDKIGFGTRTYAIFKTGD